jgi:quercetin dioxygenase-like cupin family protein
MTTHTKAPRQAHADPISVDPKHYKVEMENDQVRVLRISYGSREKSVMHGHPGSVAIFLTDLHVRFTSPDGKTEEQRGKAGQVLMTPAGEHLPENLEAKRFELILVELKR